MWRCAGVLLLLLWWSLVAHPRPPPSSRRVATTSQRRNTQHAITINHHHQLAQHRPETRAESHPLDRSSSLSLSRASIDSPPFSSPRPRLPLRVARALRARARGRRARWSTRRRTRSRWCVGRLLSQRSGRVSTSLLRATRLAAHPHFLTSSTPPQQTHTHTDRGVVPHALSQGVPRVQGAAAAEAIGVGVGGIGVGVSRPRARSRASFFTTRIFPLLRNETTAAFVDVGAVAARARAQSSPLDAPSHTHTHRRSAPSASRATRRATRTARAGTTTTTGAWTSARRPRCSRL